MWQRAASTGEDYGSTYSVKTMKWSCWGRSVDDRSHSLIRFRAFEASTRRLSPRCGGFVCPSVHGNWLSLCERKIFQRFTLQDYFECFSGQVRSSMGAYAGAVYNQIPLRLRYSFGLRVAIAQADDRAWCPYPSNRAPPDAIAKHAAPLGCRHDRME